MREGTSCAPCPTQHNSQPPNTRYQLEISTPKSLLGHFKHPPKNSFSNHTHAEAILSCPSQQTVLKPTFQ